MMTHVAQWGNSMAVRLPATMIQQLGLKKGSPIEMQVTNHQLTIKPAQNLDALLARITDENLPDYDDFDDAPVGKEVW